MTHERTGVAREPEPGRPQHWIPIDADLSTVLMHLIPCHDCGVECDCDEPYPGGES